KNSAVRKNIAGWYNGTRDIDPKFIRESREGLRPHINLQGTSNGIGVGVPKIHAQLVGDADIIQLVGLVDGSGGGTVRAYELQITSHRDGGLHAEIVEIGPSLPGANNQGHTRNPAIGYDRRHLRWIVQIIHINRGSVHAAAAVVGEFFVAVNIDSVSVGGASAPGATAAGLQKEGLKHRGIKIRRAESSVRRALVKIRRELQQAMNARRVKIGRVELDVRHREGIAGVGEQQVRRL